VAEEYCWAITHAEKRSYCGRSGSSVLKSGLQLDSLMYLTICILKSGLQLDCLMYLTICILKSDLRKIRLAPDLPEPNYWVSPGVSVLVTEASFGRHMEKEAACPLSVLENVDYVLEIWGFAFVRKWPFQ